MTTQYKMKKSSELKAMAKQRIFPRLSPLVGAVLIFSGIFIGLAFIIAFIYAGQLISQGVFASEEAMLNYLNETMSTTNTGADGVIDTLISYAFDILIGALLATLTTGFMYICLKAARNENIKASDIFAVYKMNPDRIILIYLIGFVAKFICMIPSYICDYIFPNQTGISAAALVIFAIEIAGYILQICVSVFLSQAYFIYLDNPEQNSLITVITSIAIMKKNWLSFLILMLSFLPWYIVIFCTFGFAVLWVLPFMYVTYALFYMNLRGELGTVIDTLV